MLCPVTALVHAVKQFAHLDVREQVVQAVIDFLEAGLEVAHAVPIDTTYPP